MGCGCNSVSAALIVSIYVEFIYLQKMNTEKIYHTCVGNAVNITGCQLRILWMSRRTDYVEARMLIVAWLSGYGLTDVQLADLTGLTRQGVNHLRNTAAFKPQSKRFKAMFAELTAEMSKMIH